MQDLIRRLEETTEGSRELDCAVACAKEGRIFQEIVGRRVTFLVEGVGHVVWRPLEDIPHYTTSLDAALTLVPDGWDWRVQKSEEADQPGLAVLSEKELYAWDWDNSAMAATPALALCIAALKARETE